MESPAINPGVGTGVQGEPGRPVRGRPIDVGTHGTAPLGRRDVPDALLDRGVSLAALPVALVVAAVIVGTAVALRLAALDVFALSGAEAERSYDAYALYRGQPLAAGDSLDATAPLFLLLQSMMLFLFGATDATARLAPALLGLALLPLALALRPFVGRSAALGMAGMIAVSPTLVFASRTADPEIGVACFALLLVVAVLRAGLPGRGAGSARTWAAVAGIAVAAMLASGPTAITVLIGLAVGAVAALAFDRSAASPSADAAAADGVEPEAVVRPAEPTHGAEPIAPDQPSPGGAVQAGLRALTGTPGALLAAAIGFLATTLALFTRFFSDLDAVSGFAETFADWGRLLATAPSPTPTQFFLLSVLLYEFLAVVFAIVASANSADAAEHAEDGAGGVSWAFFAAWFGATLLLFAFSSGRAPQHAVHVALPLVLLGGMGVGNLLGAVDWRDVLRGAGGLLYLAILGAVVGLIGVGILANRIDTAVSPNEARLQVALVALVVVGGLVAFAVSLSRAEAAEGRSAQPGRIALLVALTLLGLVTVRSTMTLNFYNVDNGTELLAQGTPTGSVKPLVSRLQRLSRDVSVDRSSVRDPFGTYGMTVALDERVEWPFRWYLRDFTDVFVAPEGTAPGVAAEVAIAPDDVGMAEVGYTPEDYPFRNRVPPAYESPDLGSVAADVVFPGNWLESSRYLLFRELDEPVTAETIAVGFNRDLAARLFPSTAPAAPTNLFELTEPGVGQGQLSGPRGIGTSPDGSIVYVVDSDNLRVQRYEADGTYVGTWGGSEDANVQFGSRQFTSGVTAGPTGLTVGPDGTVYVADTWGMVVVGLSPDGAVVREIGRRDVETDIGDDPAQVQSSPGLFFGPRAVAVAGDEIYVTDTGNERVQVFGPDGTFRRAWGGFGQGPNQLIEPVGIAVGPDGAVYVADSGNSRISVFAADGTPLEQWPVDAWAGLGFDPETQSRPGFEPYLAFGEDGLLYVSSRATGSVEVIGPGGRLERSIPEVEGEPLAGPIGVGIARDGSLLITDSDAGRVFRQEVEAVRAQPRDQLPGDEAPTTPPADGAGTDEDPAGVTPTPPAGATQPPLPPPPGS